MDLSRQQDDLHRRRFCGDAQPVHPPHLVCDAFSSFPLSKHLLLLFHIHSIVIIVLVVVFGVLVLIAIRSPKSFLSGGESSSVRSAFSAPELFSGPNEWVCLCFSSIDWLDSNHVDIIALLFPYRSCHISIGIQTSTSNGTPTEQ
ncbi:hypothetical protein BU24DRAFT_58497 [Aaosphaeria arxii CBS 175.79]|uniref:Uncharacterized protein n=1 Tax=Aaosphaeria arxii CBS 175.79 TaxID=1450172 RepID=A0A6A5XC88_9PLEO|nr:uncharacterized protein BU24DRAFT_58497 [Aaosphaeria arxii CBS 175.79]KAF2010436.1 hypothetical protein BU24DRAFT_58497 [Aaosphaeria arxii CBS 175.79]